MKYPDGADSVNGFYAGASVGTRLADALAPDDDGLDCLRDAEHVGTITGDALNTVTVSYDLNGATGNTPENAVVNFGADTVIAAAPSGEDVIFIEWNTEAEGGGQTYDAGLAVYPAKDLLLYAIWEAAEQGGGGGD
jgi:hypothetical protein